MRSAARSNWLATMAFPDIALRGVAGAVTGPPSESGLEATAGEAGRRVLRFRQCVGDVDATRAAAPGVGEHADYVRRSRRRCGVVRGVLEHEHQPGAVAGHRGLQDAPPGVAG